MLCHDWLRYSIAGDNPTRARCSWGDRDPFTRKKLTNLKGSRHLDLGERNVPSRIASTILLMSDFGMYCDVRTGGMRLLDMMNDVNSRYLKVENAKVFPRSDVDSIKAFGDATVVKDQVQLAVSVGDGKKKDDKLYFATLERRTVDTILSMTHGLVKGQLHVKQAKDAASFLSLEAAGFIPVTRATITGFATDAKSLESPFVVVNKNAISSIAFG